MTSAIPRPQGVIVPMLTPFLDQSIIDAPGLRKLIRRSVDAGVDAIFMGGSAAQGPMLTDDQWQLALETTIDEVAGKCLVLAGVITTSTQRALKQIEISRRAGCPTIVVTPTFYITLNSPKEMLAHFQACREATDQEMIIYNIPSCTGSFIPIETVTAVAEHGWAKALKESSGDRTYFTQVLEAVKNLDMAVLQGNEPDIAWGLQQGAAGIVPVCANCEPATFVAAVRAAREKDWARLDTLQSRIDAVRNAVLVGDHNWIAGLACAVGLQGIGNGKPLLPLQKVDDERREIIREFLAHSSAHYANVSL